MLCPEKQPVWTAWALGFKPHAVADRLSGIGQTTRFLCASVSSVEVVLVLGNEVTGQVSHQQGLRTPGAAAPFS